MPASTERIVCTRCGSNNFPGRDRCWHCGHSLPPPEVRRPGGMVQPGATWAPAAGPRTPWALVVLFVLLGAVIVTGGWLGLSARRASRTSAAEERLRQLDRRIEELRGQGAPTVSDPSALDPDSEAARARREVERLERKYGLPPR